MKKNNEKILLSVAILFVFGFFGPINVFAAGPATVNLGTASNFAILSKTGITDVPTSIITGNVGSSPITGASIGVTCAEVTGSIYSTNATGPMPCRITGPSLLTTAVSNMDTAYTDAATRTPATSPELNIGSGTVTTQTLAPGLYTWTTPVDITGDITLSGSASDVWIFQVNGTLTIDAGKNIILTGGALPENIFWQTTSTVNLMAGSHFEGNILSQTDIAMRSAATLTGRALAQTAVTLIANTVSIPAGFVPTPIPANLTVINTVTNNYSGIKNASNFTINVTGTGVSTPSFPGASGTGTTVTLDAGTYSVDENPDSGYIKSLSSNCSGTIAAGEDRTCNVTNNDKAPSSSGGSGGGTTYGCKDPNATNYNFFSASKPSLCTYTTINDATAITKTSITSSSFRRTLKLKMTGDDVKALQVYLNTHGYIIAKTGAGSTGHETTLFGVLTKKAVMKFQLANDLNPDGIVGVNTFSLEK